MMDIQEYDLVSNCSSVPSITEEPEWITYRDYTFPYDFRLPLQEELGDVLTAKAEAQLSYWGFYHQANACLLASLPNRVSGMHRKEEKEWAGIYVALNLCQSDNQTVQEEASYHWIRPRFSYTVASVAIAAFSATVDFRKSVTVVSCWVALVIDAIRI
jgi:hypothetical protein